jgi:hypothetical protein
MLPAAAEPPASASSADLGPGTVAIAAAAAALAAGCALASLTYGWSHSVAALVGAAAAAALGWAAWRRCPAERIADRGALLLATTLALALFAVYAADTLDWRPFGIDDATAGLAIGLALLAALPGRYALARADIMPSAAGMTITAIVVGVIAWTAFFEEPLPEGFDDAGRMPLAALAARALAVLVAGLGYLYALRRGLYGTALILLLVAGFACAAFGNAGHLGAMAAVCAGALAVAAMAPALVLRRRADGGRTLATPEPLLVPVAALCAAAFGAGFAASGLLVVAGALAAWWFYLRRRIARATGPAFVPVSGSQLLLRLGLAGGLGATVYSHALLVDAALADYTGPMLLAELRKRGLYTVSDLKFARALVRDQYLWRDEVAADPRLAAPSPDRLIEGARHRRDAWSTAMPAASERRPDAVDARGYGLDVRAEGTRLRVIDVVDGSPAHAAGVRRGDAILSVDGFPIDRLAEAAAARAGDAARFELEAPDGARREVSLRRGRYALGALAALGLLETGGRRVGYVALRHFNGTARAEFDAAAQRLRAAGIDELVLDLRLNGGGSLHAATHVASAIGGRRLDGRTFLRFEHNERHRDKDREAIFRAPAWGGLGLGRLFVITSSETCSAAEALVHGLAAHLPVIVVGSTTCGKPVGFQVMRYGDISYWVITFRDVNARGESDYYGGLAPTCLAADDAARSLGDAAEPSLRAALHYVRFGRCPA